MPARDRLGRRPSEMAGANHVGTSQHLAEPPTATHIQPVAMPGPKKKNEPPRRTLTVRLPVVVIERLRRVARDAAGMPCFATMAGIVEAGVVSECDRVEAELQAAFKTGVSGQGSSPRPIRIRRCVPELNNTRWPGRDS